MTPLACRRIAGAGAFVAGAAVAIDAFGAHALRATLPPDMFTVFEIAVRYQMYHGLALVAAGLAGLSGAPPRGRLLGAACWAFGAGILLFCGSLYALALTGHHAAAAPGPAGGLAFIAGWALFAASWWRGPRA